MLSWTVRLGVKGPNERLHWRAKARQTAQQRQATLGSCLVELRPEGMENLRKLQRPLVVTLVRIGTRELDSDNLEGALKHVRDEVASILGHGDGPRDPILWVCKQERGFPAVRVEVRSAESAEAA